MGIQIMFMLLVYFPSRCMCFSNEFCEACNVLTLFTISNEDVINLIIQSCWCSIYM